MDMLNLTDVDIELQQDVFVCFMGSGARNSLLPEKAVGVLQCMYEALGLVPSIASSPEHSQELSPGIINWE